MKILFLITDFGFLLYWGFTALAACKLVNIPEEWLYKDYTDPVLVVWNWSFMPLDILAASSGLAAVWLMRQNKNWQQVALISMTLTFCAGFMALSFWAFQRSFDIAWWAANLFLVIWPLLMFRYLQFGTPTKQNGNKK